MKKLILGVALALTGLWGGSYIVGSAKYFEWFIFPTMVTSGLMIAIGVFLIYEYDLGHDL